MIACAMLLCMATTTRAQEFRIGAVAGMNVSAPTNASTRLGYHVGVRSEWNFRDTDQKGAFLSLSALLTEKGYKSDTFYDATGRSMTWRVRPTYLELPLHVGYRLPVGQRVTLSGSVGPYLGIGLFGKSRLTTELNGTTTTTTAATNVFDAMRRVDCGVGLRYDISMIVFLGGKNWSEVNFCLSLSRNCTNKGHGNVYKRRKCRIPVLPQQRVRR